MKYLAFILFLVIQFPIFAQQIEPAPLDKAVVYFVRATNFGGVVNFIHFDGEKAIGRFPGKGYLRYECEPGEHLFWAKAENRDFIEAKLEAGKIYIIDVIPIMGGMKAGVKLVPVNSNQYKLKKIKKLINKKDPIIFSEKRLMYFQENSEGIIKKGLEKYKKNKNKVESLGSFSFKPEDLKWTRE